MTAAAPRAVDTAAALARAGWGVFPVRLARGANGKWAKAPAHRKPANDPDNRDRRPAWTPGQLATIPSWQDVSKGGFHQAVWRPEDAVQFFGECRRDRLAVGAIHGDVACVDIDRAVPAPAGLLLRLRAAGACVVESMGGGRHFLFRARPDSVLREPGAAALYHKGIGFGDLKMVGGQKGYAVAPPILKYRRRFPARPEFGLGELSVERGYRIEGDAGWRRTYPPVKSLRLMPKELEAEIAGCRRKAAPAPAEPVRGGADKPAGGGAAWTRKETPSTFAARKLAAVGADALGVAVKRLGEGHWIHNAVCGGVVAPLIWNGGWTPAAESVVRDWWAGVGGPAAKIDEMAAWAKGAKR